MSAPHSAREVRKGLRTDFNPGLRLRLIRSAFRARQIAHLPALWTGGRVVKPIFVIGAPRSGTSLLYAILRASRDLAHWPGEAHEVWEADYHPALTGWLSNALSASDARGRPVARIRRMFFLVTGNRKTLLDKTPRNSLRVPFIDAVFPDARFVFIQRDGRDNVNSLINAWRTTRYRTYRLPEPHAIPGVDPNWWKFVLYPEWRKDIRGPLEVVCAKQWAVSNLMGLEALGRVDRARWTTLRHEDLVERPVDEVGRVMHWLGLDYEDAVRDKAAAAHSMPVNVVTPPQRGKWRRENPREVESVLVLIAPAMKALGYEIDQ